MEQRPRPDPEVGDELAERIAELQRARNGVMLARTELAADPVHYKLSGTGARRKARYDRTALMLSGKR